MAFLSGPCLYVVPTTGGQPHFMLAGEEGPDGPGAITWGAAEFIAAEEMARSRGFWWSPDGRSLLAARADNGPVGTWWTADPSQPASPPRPHRYPAAGTADALVSLWYMEVVRDRRPARPGRLGQLDGSRTWWPCTGAVGGRLCCWWSSATTRRPPCSPSMSRTKARRGWRQDGDGKDGMGGNARTSTLLEVSDAAWVDWPGGVPAWLEGGELLWAVSGRRDVAAEGGR